MKMIYKCRSLLVNMVNSVKKGGIPIRSIIPSSSSSSSSSQGNQQNHQFIVLLCTYLSCTLELCLMEKVFK